MRKVSLIVLLLIFCHLTSVAAIASPTVLESWVWSGHTYSLLANKDDGDTLSGITWTDAEAYAVNTLGGHLASVDSVEESNWLWNTFEKNKVNLWIGLTDQVTEGQFKWIANGQDPLFTNWWPGEPNNWYDEDYVFILNTSTHADPAGKWNDGQSGWTSFYGSSNYAIAEIPASPVPEPATMLLFGVGLLGLAGVRRKLKK